MPNLNDSHKYTIGCDWCSKRIHSNCGIFERQDKQSYICLQCFDVYGPSLVEGFQTRSTFDVLVEKQLELALSLMSKLANKDVTNVEDGSWSEC